jgi:hypothetical protein
MTRLVTLATLIALGFAVPAHAQQVAALASDLNKKGWSLVISGAIDQEQGKDLKKKGKSEEANSKFHSASQQFEEASAKFRDAIAYVPDPEYFLHLCASLFYQGKFDEALTACNAVANYHPTPEQQAQTKDLIGIVKDQAAAQNIELYPTGTGGGGGAQDISPDTTGSNGGPPPPPPGYAAGLPPQQSLFVAAPQENKYTWTFGVDLFGGGGQIGQKNVYGNTAMGFRVKGDYLLNPASRFGAQVYLGITQFDKGSMQAASVSTLGVFDAGIAAYKHLCSPTSRLCITPLAGVQIAMMSPAGESDGYGSQVFNYTALGGRAELSAQYGFGSRMEHVLSFGVGANLYTSVFSVAQGANWTKEEAGLDKGGFAGYLTIGYTHRFNTPVGNSPLFHM